MDFIKVELDPDGESYLTSDYGYHLTEVKQEKDPLLLSFPECEMENKVSYMFLSVVRHVLQVALTLSFISHSFGDCMFCDCYWY
jgi:hypothetical protein